MSDDGTRDRPQGAVVARLHPDISVTLERVERRRAHLWSVAAFFILVASVLVAVVLSGSEPFEVLPEAPALRWALLGVGFAFVLYIIDQEHRLRGLTRSLFEAEVLAASLHSRVRDLTTLTRVGQLVNSVLTMEEVLEVLLDAVFDLTGAARGSVLLADEGRLEVAVAAGQDAPPRGAVVPTDGGVIGWIVANREPLLIQGDLAADQFPGHHASARQRGSSITAPMLAGDTLVGVLAVERAPGAAAFTEIQLRSVALFASQAATAVINARRYEEERSTVQQLADALERRSEFVATLVHELKSPLTSIVGFSSILTERADRLSEDQREQMLTSVRNQAQRLRAMVDEVLNVASADAGAQLAREAVDLGQLVGACLDEARAEAVGHDGIDRDISVRVPDQAPVVYGDPEALRRVLDNLIENAVKYSPPGTPIEIAVEETAERTRLTVTDRGGTLAEGDVENVFERFRRSERGRTGGAGLGLYIVRSLVQAHGGRVWAETSPGEHTSFHVELPRRRSGRDADGADGRDRVIERAGG